MIEEDIKKLQDEMVGVLSRVSSMDSISREVLLGHRNRLDRQADRLEMLDSGLEGVAKELAALRARVNALEAPKWEFRVPPAPPPVPPEWYGVNVCPPKAIERPKSVKLTKGMLRGGLLVEFVDPDGNEPRLVIAALYGEFVVIDERGKVTCSAAQDMPGLYQTALTRGPFGSLGVLWHEVWTPGSPGDKPWVE